jgi:L-threonylcarbamoyladenylate synthase
MNPDVLKAAEILKSGGVVIIPTDTVFGISTLYGNKNGIERIYRIKKRDKKKPLAVLILSVNDVWKWVEKTPAIEKICRESWPGPTTLIVKTKDGGSIGFRMPDCEPVLELMRLTGPLCATSANVSGEKAAAKIDDIPQEVRDQCDLVVDFSVKLSGKPSKVLDLRNEDLTIIRE